jgi:hypothetical protein
VLFKGWYFLNEKFQSSEKKRDAMGNMDIALYFPLFSTLKDADGRANALLPTGVMSSTGGAKFIKVDYSEGANESNGFKQSWSFNVSFEL